MSCLAKLSLVAVIALMLVPNSHAKEWVPPEMIEALKASIFQPDSSGPTNMSKNMRADNPRTMTDAKQGAIPSVHHSTLNELLPPDIMRTWVFPLDP